MPFLHMRALFFGALVILVTLCTHSLAAEPIKVGVYYNKPIVFMNENGRAQGVFIDLLVHIARKEGWKLTYRNGSFSECLAWLESGEIDLMPAIAYSKKRAEQYQFTYETVLTNWAQIYVKGKTRVESILDLQGMKVGVKMGDIHLLAIRELANQFGIKCRFIETDEYRTVFELVEHEIVQAGVVNRLFGVQNRKDYAVQETPVIFNPIEMRFASPGNADPALLDTIDTHLRAMIAQEGSFYQRALNRWLIGKSDWKWPAWAVYALIIGSAVTLLIFIANIYLRAKVTSRTRDLSLANERLKAEITDRIQAEEDLRRFERIIASSNDHMALIDRDYRLLVANQAYCQGWNFSRDWILGRTVAEVFGESAFSGQMKANIDRAFAGQQARFQSWVEFPRLGRRHMDIAYFPYVTEDNRIAGCVFNSKDITEQKKLEAQLKQAQKLETIGTLAGGVAHDLNNVLSGIVSYPDLLLMQIPDDSPLRHPLKTIRKTGEKAAAIVQDLLTLSRRGLDSTEVMYINTIIEEYLASPEHRQLLSHYPKVEVHTVLEEDLLNMDGSPVHISKTVMNLVVNAAEAMPGGGIITIRTENLHVDETFTGFEDAKPGDYIQMIVSDTGVGISADDQKKIFEPFYTKKVMGRSGTGLGMAVVWSTVKDHGGMIAVTSELGKGATFTLGFPATWDTLALPDTNIPIEQFRGNGESILIVDDVEEQREIASALVTQLGYRPSAVSNGRKAIEYVGKHRVDLVLLDMIMPPGMDGLSTYKAILHIVPSQKAIIASGFSESERVKEALRIGVGQYIKKPYTLQKIGMAIRKEIDR